MMERLLRPEMGGENQRVGGYDEQLNMGKGRCYGSMVGV